MSASARAADGLNAMRAGLDHINDGDCEAALQDFSQALSIGDLSPDDRVRSYFDRGVAADSCGDIRAAMSDYSEALKLRADFAPALINRANAYRLQKLFVEAKQDYEAALGLHDAPSAFAYYGLGAIAAEEGQYKQALAYFDRALVYDSGYTQALEARAAVDRAYRSASAQDIQPSQSHSMPHTARTRATARAGVPALRLSLPPAVLPAQGAEGNGPQYHHNVRLHPADTAGEPQTRSPGNRVRQNRGSENDQAAASPVGGGFVQLGAFRSHDEAAENWQRIAARLSDVLAGRTPQISETNLPGRGHFFRLRVVTDSLSSAEKLCVALKSQGLTCWVALPPR